MTGVSGSDIYTAKYAAANGALLWEKRYSGPSVDVGTGVAVDAAGNVIVTGYSRNTADYNNQGYDDCYTAKYAAADGALLWERRYNGPANQDDQALALAVDTSGNVVVAGYSLNTNNFHSSDYYTAKYAASDGTLLWEKRYDGPASGWDEAKALIVDSNGNAIVTGFSRSTEFLTYDWYTAKYATSDGTLLWQQRYTGLGNGNDKAVAVAVDGNGNVIVTGISEDILIDGVSDSVYYTAKYAAINGALLWEQRHHRGAPSALALDADGNVIVTGSDAGSNSFLFDNYYTAKYAAADGTLLWERSYNGPANFTDNAVAVAVDGAGNVVVTGYSSTQSNLVDYYTAKYAAADGAVLWEQHYNGPANNHDFAVAIVAAGNGNVAVTGYSRNGSGNEDFYTANYAGSNGSLLWERRYNGPANRDDRPEALAVDGSGNVFVAGNSYNGTISDGYTAKYAAADGALLWEKRSGRGMRTLAIDNSGDVLVAGYASNGTNFDYYTAKYASADGALLWEKRYNGPANRDDVVGLHGLALGRNGKIAVAGYSENVSGPPSVYGYATVLYRETLDAISIAIVPTGVRIRYSGMPGRSYNIERAPAVTGPWSTIAMPTVPLNGIIEYIDTNAPPGSAFYRAMQQ